MAEQPIQAETQYGKLSKFVPLSNFGYSEGGPGGLIRQPETSPIPETDQLRADLAARWTTDSLRLGSLPFHTTTNILTDGTEQKEYQFDSEQTPNAIYDRFKISKVKEEAELLEKVWTKQEVTLEKDGTWANAISGDGWIKVFFKQLDEEVPTNGVAAKLTMRKTIVTPGDWAVLVAGSSDGGWGQFTATPATDEALQIPVVFKDYWKANFTGWDQDPGAYPSIRQNGPDNPFVDYYFNLTVPFAKNELTELGNSLSTMFIDVRADYNFLNQSYEELVGLTAAAEIYLPNMYLYLTAKYAEAPEAGIQYVTTLAGSLPEVSVDGSGGIDILEENIGEKSIQDKVKFFSAYGAFLESYVTETYVVESLKNLHMGFSNENVNFLLDYSQKSNSFPMFVNVKFSTQTDSIIAQDLRDFQFDYPLLKSLMQSNVNRSATVAGDETSGAPQGFTRIDNRKDGQFLQDSSPYSPLYDPNTPSTLVEYQAARSLYYLDILDWLDQYGTSGNDIFDGQAETQYRFVGESQKELFVSNNFFKSIYTMVMKEKIKKIAQEKVRDFEDLLRGKPAYNESIAYKVTKHRVNNGAIDPVPSQTFYFTNSNELKDLNFIDTQVAFGREYKYVVSAYCLVVGTEYFYDDLVLDYSQPTDETKKLTEAYAVTYKATFNVYYRPTVRLVEVPYFGFEADELDSMALMWDDPPMPPEGQFIPIIGQTNKLNIFLNGATGKMVADPVVVNSNDSINLEKIRKYQNLPKSFGGKIVYEAEDAIDNFQVFRIGPNAQGNTTHPASYGDFGEVPHWEMSTPTANSVALADKILPNRDYYYMFRGIDYHGNTSLPSAIYKVKMLVEPGQDISYPLIEIVELNKTQKYVTSKPMKRFFHIEPKQAQTLLKGELLADPNFVHIAQTSQNFGLGVEDEQLFVNKKMENDPLLRRFKIRLTSKETGRKIDFNVRFVWKHKTINE
jgi:hypothetical protein